MSRRLLMMQICQSVLVKVLAVGLLWAISCSSLLEEPKRAASCPQNNILFIKPHTNLLLQLLTADAHGETCGILVLVPTVGHRSELTLDRYTDDSGLSATSEGHLFSPTSPTNENLFENLLFIPTSHHWWLVKRVWCQHITAPDGLLDGTATNKRCSLMHDDTSAYTRRPTSQRKSSTCVNLLSSRCLSKLRPGSYHHRLCHACSGDCGASCPRGSVGSGQTPLPDQLLAMWARSSRPPPPRCSVKCHPDGGRKQVKSVCDIQFTIRGAKTRK